MNWQTYYFWTSIILSVVAFQAGRSWEMDKIEKEFNALKENAAKAWMQDCDLNKERGKR